MHKIQALSNTLSNLMKILVWLRLKDLSTFLMSFFDCLNVRDLNQWRIKKKSNLKPYFSKNDERLKVRLALIACLLKWLKVDFLGYLNEWEGLC